MHGVLLVLLALDLGVERVLRSIFRHLGMDLRVYDVCNGLVVYLVVYLEWTLRRCSCCEKAESVKLIYVPG